MSEQTYIGVALDERAPEAKARDYQFDELVSTPAPVEWREKRLHELRQTPIYNQGNSGSCVAQTLRKMIGMHIENETGVFVDPSATHLYQRRANRPALGMSAVNAFQIAQQGVTLEQLAPSELLTDAEMDSFRVNATMEAIGKGLAIGNFIEVRQPSIDTLASIIQQTKKGIMSFHFFSDGLQPREWDTIPQVRHAGLPLIGPNTARHAVAYTDFTILNRNLLPNHSQFWGQKAIVADESWGLNTTFHGKRFITEAWLRTRAYYAGYFMTFKYAEPEVVKDAPFLTDLQLNSTGPEVQRLQTILQRMGHFPANVTPTQFYGNVTATALGRFQVAHNIVQPGQPGHGRFGPATRGVMNNLIK